MRAFRTATGILALCALIACDDSSSLKKEKTRVWGKEKVQEDLLEKAKTPVPFDALEKDKKLRLQVVHMDIEEIIARLGVIRYAGTAGFTLNRNGQDLKLLEETRVAQGLHGSFHIKQTNEKKELLRESFYNNGVLYVRNGNGKMRVQGVHHQQHRKLRREAFSPLSHFLRFFGERLALIKGSMQRVHGRDAMRYTIGLAPGPDLIEVEKQGKKRPLTLTGFLDVDMTSGAPLAGKVRGKLEIPAKSGGEPGRMTVRLDFDIKNIPAKELKPKEYVPTIKRREKDLDPLGFLKGGTRTSTVIQGE